MPQVPFPGMGAPQMPGGGPIMALPFTPDGRMPTFAEGGEVEDPEYMMHGGIPHLFGGGFLRKLLANRAMAASNEQAQRPQIPGQITAEEAAARVQQQIQQQVQADRAARAAQFAASMQPGASQMPNPAQAPLADRQARAARFAQMMQFAPPAMQGNPSGALAQNRGLMADGGLASLAQGGYPRRTGQISGPGSETSDSIPAMLSDGEFVMTAKAVRGAGNGSRRAGAKKMYALMHQLERNASRG